MPRQLRKGGVIAALTGALFVTGVCATAFEKGNEFSFVAAALAKDKNGDGGSRGKSENGKDKGGGHDRGGHGGNGGHGGHGGNGGHGGHGGHGGGHHDDDDGDDQGGNGGGPSEPPAPPAPPSTPAPPTPPAPPSTPTTPPGDRQNPPAAPRESSQDRWTSTLKPAARKTDPIKTSSIGKKRKKTLMDMLAEPPKGQSRTTTGKPKKSVTLVEWFAKRHAARDGKAKKTAKRQKAKSAVAKRTVRGVAPANQARAYAFGGLGIGAMEREFRARFFSQEPQMLAMRTYVVELAAFESARSLMVDAAADLDDARSKMLALDITPFRSLRGTIDGDTSEAALDPVEVAALIVARQKLADAQENLAIKAQRVDFHMLCDLVEGYPEMPGTSEMNVQYYGASAFAGLFDVIDPLEHPAGIGTASEEVRADLPVTRGKKGRVSLDVGRNTADARL